AEELGLSPGGIGVLAALEGAGAFAGALIIAVRARAIGYRRLYYFGTVGFLALVFAAGWMPSAWTMSATLFCIGLCAAGFTTMQSTLIYAVAPPEMRGRLFGLLVLCIGTGLIGFSNIGLMGEWFGGTAAIRIVAVEGLVPLVLIGIGWRELWQRGAAR
ncbi:MAG: MFS transporter, partial [Minwuiales bacterium]|nr:MFS transporter [Minwuiales bacterium]